jgi:hypothetical protein
MNQDQPLTNLQLLDIVGAEPVFETGLLLAGGWRQGSLRIR